MANKPTTFFSGTTGPEGDRPGPDRIISRIGTYLLVVLLLPVAALVYGVWISLFTYSRMPWWVPAPFAGVLTLVGIGSGRLGPAGVEAYVDAAKNVVESAGHGGLVGAIFAFMWSQAFIAIWAATCYATVVCAWKWVRRPAWQEKQILVGPIVKRRERETISEIEAGTNSPDGGITLGVAEDKRDHRFAGGRPGERYGDRVVISDAELAGHSLVCGGSGSGKTTSMLIGIRDSIRQGHGLVFVDCKGGPDVPQQIADWCQRYGREFYHWTIQDPNEQYTGPGTSPAFYDPLSRGDASRRKDLLIGSQRWDVEYYNLQLS